VELEQLVDGHLLAFAPADVFQVLVDFPQSGQYAVGVGVIEHAT